MNEGLHETTRNGTSLDVSSSQKTTDTTKIYIQLGLLLVEIRVINTSHSKSDNKLKHEEIIQMFLLTTYFFRRILKNIDNTLV